jgi:acetyl-CoA synthetase
MNYEPIKKPGISEFTVKPNLPDYKKFRKELKWDDIRRELDGFGDGRMNIAHEVIDRHIKTPLKNKIALAF